MYTIRASSLGTFNVCPYKYKYEAFSGDPLTTGLGDIVHYFARDDEGGQLLLDFYTRNLKKDIMLNNIIQKLFQQVAELKQQITDKAKRWYDEMPMMLMPTNNMIVTGTADKIVEFEGDDHVHIFDRKTCNSLDWYEDKYRDTEKFPESRIWDENLQWLFYGLGAMEYFGYEHAKFHFVALEKKNTAKTRIFTRIFSKEEGWAYFLKVCERFVECNELDMRPHDWSRYCLFPDGCSDACPNNPKNKSTF